MTDLEKLTQQILSQWGNTGDWGMAGVNRAQELAQLLAQSGVTDLNGLKLEKAQETYTPTYNDWGELNMVGAPTKTRDGYQLVSGDKKLGYLGNVGDGKDSAKSFLEQVDGKPGETTYRLGGSAAGDGWTSFDVTPGADGQFSITPKWGSSSNADEFMKAALAVAAPVAAWSAGLGMPALGEAAAAGGAGGASAADIALMGDLGGTTLTPSMWSTAFPELAAAGGLGTMAGLPAVPEALAPLSLTPEAALPALAATPAINGAVPALAGAAGAGALGAASGAGLLKLGTAALGAAAGSQKADDTTATNTRSMDPRIDQRVFGAGGLLELADKQLAANPTGQNDTMRQAQNMLRGIITDPGVGQGLVGMANRGMGMMNSPIAGNPFANWQMPSQSAQPTGLLNQPSYEANRPGMSLPSAPSKDVWAPEFDPRSRAGIPVMSPHGFGGAGGMSKLSSQDTLGFDPQATVSLVPTDPRNIKGLNPQDQQERERQKAMLLGRIGG